MGLVSWLGGCLGPGHIHGGVWLSPWSSPRQAGWAFPWGLERFPESESMLCIVGTQYPLVAPHGPLSIPGDSPWALSQKEPLKISRYNQITTANPSLVWLFPKSEPAFRTWSGSRSEAVGRKLWSRGTVWGNSDAMSIKGDRGYLDYLGTYIIELIIWWLDYRTRKNREERNQGGE